MSAITNIIKECNYAPECLDLLWLDVLAWIFTEDGKKTAINHFWGEKKLVALISVLLQPVNRINSWILRNLSALHKLARIWQNDTPIFVF